MWLRLGARFRRRFKFQCAQVLKGSFELTATQTAPLDQSPWMMLIDCFRCVRRTWITSSDRPCSHDEMREIGNRKPWKHVLHTGLNCRDWYRFFEGMSIRKPQDLIWRGRSSGQSWNFLFVKRVWREESETLAFCFKVHKSTRLVVWALIKTTTRISNCRKVCTVVENRTCCHRRRGS